MIFVRTIKYKNTAEKAFENSKEKNKHFLFYGSDCGPLVIGQIYKQSILNFSIKIFVTIFISIYIIKYYT